MAPVLMKVNFVPVFFANCFAPILPWPFLAVPRTRLFFFFFLASSDFTSCPNPYIYGGSEDNTNKKKNMEFEVNSVQKEQEKYHTDHNTHAVRKGDRQSEGRRDKDRTR